MKHSDFAIEQLKERLHEKAMKESTPKKFGNAMFEAWEVINQLQEVIKHLQEEATNG